MEVLNPALPAARRRRLFGVLFLLAAAGCALVNVFGGDKPLAFSHRIHLGEGLDCVDCHKAPPGGGTPGMPVVGQCMLCHKEIDAKKGPERQIAQLFGDGGFKAAHLSRLGGDVFFQHGRHEKDRKCSACHVGIETADAVDASVAVRMAACIACHRDTPAPAGPVASECATCHREIRADRPPPSHGLAWRGQHGKVVRAHGTATADNCAMCHQESTCASCHLDTPPASHSGYFRLRGHGVMARMDRQACATCHRADSCDSCHRETRPLNHTGLWGAPRDNHCVSCHFPLGTTECATCHRDAPSHATAAGMPQNHTLGMNCRQCHGLTAPLPHVDKGDECSRCHR